MQLYPHQVTALDMTKGMNLVAYYLDMGLGKTYVGSEKMMSFGSTGNLIVCQKSKVQDWIDHFNQNYSEHPYLIQVYDLTKKGMIEKFLNTVKQAQEPMEMHENILGEPCEPYLMDNPDPCQYIGVINYDLVFRRPDLLNLENFTLMLDESSIIQNEKAKRSKFNLKLKPKNVILLSGTPTSGKYENLWTQIHLLGWNISFQLYQRQYVNWKTIEVGGVPLKIVDKDDPYKNTERLKSKLREHGAVFMKTEECFDLPEQTFIDIAVNSSKEYRKFKKDRIVTTADGIELVGDTKLTQMLYERQLCGMYSKDKLQAFKDLVSSTQDRLIVFYNFNDELYQMKQIAEELERPISEVNGHIKDMTAYEENDNSITLIQYQAGSMGLNLQKANKIIYFTLPLMSELFEQSKKRIHRIGQKMPCFYYTMTVKNSIEGDIKKVLEMRKDFTDELFERK